MSKHSSSPSRWRRRILGVPVIGWILGVSGTALAVAGFFVLLSVSGSLTAADGIDVKYNVHAGNTGTAVTGSPTCTLTYVSVSEIQLDMSNALPGDECRFRVETQNFGQVPAYLNGFSLATADYTAEINTGTGDKQCGDSLAAGGQAGDVGFVDVDITAAASLAPSSSYTFNPAVDGFDWGISFDGICS